jgi:hypothetical protein
MPSASSTWLMGPLKARRMYHAKVRSTSPADAANLQTKSYALPHRHQRKQRRDWKIIEVGRRLAPIPAMSLSPISTRPEVGLANPAISRRTVVLPQT